MTREELLAAAADAVEGAAQHYATHGVRVIITDRRTGEEGAIMFPTRLAADTFVEIMKLSRSGVARLG